jgi:precorrin-8X/cobalt-precorrin-8 methylmutase
MSQPMKPEDIQATSFAIVEQRLGGRPEDPRERRVVIRVAHATADVDLARGVLFHPEAVAAGIAALRSGAHVVTDVEMVRTGIRKHPLTGMGQALHCLLNDEEVIGTARRLGLTRAQTAMRQAATLLAGGIAAVGNAPTALFELCRMLREDSLRPALVVGVPIGFVGAAESKRELLRVSRETGVPYICNRGRRGGSAVAASIVNALILLAESEQDHG